MPEPKSKPILTGPDKSNEKDAKWVLQKISNHLRRGGSWTDTLRETVDLWLDFLLRTQKEGLSSQ